MTPQTAESPDVRDDRIRDLAREFLQHRRCMGIEGCSRPATHVLTVTFSDTLANIPVTTCAFHRRDVIQRFASCPACHAFGVLQPHETLPGAFACAKCEHLTLSPGCHPIRRSRP